MVSCRLSDLKIDATNVALPSSLIFEDDEGQLVFTFYVQVGDGFLSKEQLQPALLVCKFKIIQVMIVAKPHTES